MFLLPLKLNKVFGSFSNLAGKYDNQVFYKLVKVMQIEYCCY